MCVPSFWHIFTLWVVDIIQIIFHKIQYHSIHSKDSPNIAAMGCRQCLSLSVVQLKGKDCGKPHCCIWSVISLLFCRLMAVKWKKIRHPNLVRWKTTKAPQTQGAQKKILSHSASSFSLVSPNLPISINLSHASVRCVMGARQHKPYIAPTISLALNWFPLTNCH